MIYIIYIFEMGQEFTFKTLAEAEIFARQMFVAGYKLELRQKEAEEAPYEKRGQCRN